ncbi:MAG: phosphopyruvate hydratase [Chloroflexota bacterium]
MPTIEALRALEILDSRGRPTVEATCTLASGARGRVQVPSGASTGAAEALELRDGDPRRYRGLGVTKAVGNIAGEIRFATAGKAFATQRDLDAALLALDGTPNKARLGANAILAVSLAFARACAADAGEPLYRWFAHMAGLQPDAMPRPTINLFSGGKHAGGQVSIQDVLIVPVAARTTAEALAATYAVYQAAADAMRRDSGVRALVADEGGLAPDFPGPEAMIAAAVAAIEEAGYRPGDEVALAVDVASSHFHRDGAYWLDGAPLAPIAMIVRLDAWVGTYPIISIEDGLAEDDWGNWPALRRRLADRAMVLGDDFLATNPARIRRAIDAGAANALLLKVNQIGTVTEALDALLLARSAGWRVTVSARSGETEDDWLADLAVGWAGDQIKIGSITRSERLAKYNRLLAIEAETGWPLR